MSEDKRPFFLWKIDPQRPLPSHRLQEALEAAPDGVVVGGSSGLTAENVNATLASVVGHGLWTGIEVTSVEVVVGAAPYLSQLDRVLVPFVLNTTSPLRWQQEALTLLSRFSQLVPWEKLRTEGYLILNPQATAYQVAACFLPAPEEIVPLMQWGALLGLDVLYVEYSGRFGSPLLLTRIAAALHQTRRNSRLIYGGGLRRAEQVAQMAPLVDGLIAGDLLYDDVPLAPLVAAARNALVHKEKRQRC
ncbi:MAG: hypothetical protein IMW91_01225 [Firmicutes bacterium]|nr:hypothetical protein [Bacillota bacterium]